MKKILIVIAIAVVLFLGLFSYFAVHSYRILKSGYRKKPMKIEKISNSENTKPVLETGVKKNNELVKKTEDVNEGSWTCSFFAQIVYLVIVYIIVVMIDILFAEFFKKSDFEQLKILVNSDIVPCEINCFHSEHEVNQISLFDPARNIFNESLFCCRTPFILEFIVVFVFVFNWIIFTFKNIISIYFAFFKNGKKGFFERHHEIIRYQYYYKYLFYKPVVSEVFFGTLSYLLFRLTIKFYFRNLKINENNPVQEEIIII